MGIMPFYKLHFRDVFLSHTFPYTHCLTLFSAVASISYNFLGMHLGVMRCMVQLTWLHLWVSATKREQGDGLWRWIKKSAKSAPQTLSKISQESKKNTTFVTNHENVWRWKQYKLLCDSWIHKISKIHLART